MDKRTRKQLIEENDQLRKQLNLLKSELMGLSANMKSETHVYWHHNDDYVEGMNRYSNRIDNIIKRYYNPVVPTVNLFGTEIGWKNPIFRPIFDLRIPTP